jgi:hypothetical protein
MGTGVMASMLGVMTSDDAYYRGVLKEDHKDTLA